MKQTAGGQMSFLDHLEEFRKAVIRSLIGLVIAMFACYYFAPYIQDLLVIPFREHAIGKLALLAPTEGFVVRLKISLISGLFLSSPWIFLQLWLFVAPGLYAKERKKVFPVVLFTSICFISGAAFAYHILPWATGFFLSFGTSEVENTWSLGRYLDYVLRLFLAFGVVFELPVLIYFLARLGVITPAFLRTYRRYAYILVLIGAAMITPPDVFTQVVLAGPMVILYEGSILLSVIAHRRYLAASPLNEEEHRSERSTAIDEAVEAETPSPKPEGE